MAKIGLIDIDSKIPNLALMKLSAWHKAQGDDVELTIPVLAPAYDKAYVSKVFVWTGLPEMQGNVEIGGTGWDVARTLPREAEAFCPDYDLYVGMDYSVGFLTRGCNRCCPWCIVPEKEGAIKPAADIEDFLRHKRAILLDNNVLSHSWGINQIQKIAGMDVRVDFNQGLDARMIDQITAKLLARVKWIRAIRLACDTQAMKSHIENAVKMLRGAGFKKEIWCYLLVADNVDDAHDRAEFLRGLGVTPFAQPYRDRNGTEPNRQAKRFARWVNRREIFKTVAWKDYGKMEEDKP